MKRGAFKYEMKLEIKMQSKKKKRMTKSYEFSVLPAIITAINQGLIGAAAPPDKAKYPPHLSHLSRLSAVNHRPQNPKLRRSLSTHSRNPTDLAGVG